MQRAFERSHPNLRLDIARVDGERRLRAAHGGMRVFWVFRGQGEVFLPRGYRTQEGDGQPLPASYRPDPTPPELADLLATIRAGLATVAAAASVPVQAIVGRQWGEAFVGDFAGDLWKLEQTPRPWAADQRVEAALAALFGCYRAAGHSTLQADAWEPLVEGDQIAVCGDEEAAVRGQFACLTMENLDRRTRHVSTARRLRYLLDTAGGCSPGFDPFRRLPLTWWPNYAGERGDGLNWVNSHVVNIPAETSPTHFHPPKTAGDGGIAQSEMYLVLDPRAYQLGTAGRRAVLNVFPDLRDLRRCEQHELEPGMFIYMPPGTGHRGLDAFVNVLTIPGFKPHNELYLDRDICEQGGGAAPYNENLLHFKNFERIEEYL